MNIYIMNRPINTCIFICFLLLILSGHASAEKAKFLYPADKTLISVPEIRIIGKIGNNENINLAIKNKSGEKNITITSADKYFNQTAVCIPVKFDEVPGFPVDQYQPFGNIDDLNYFIDN